MFLQNCITSGTDGRSFQIIQGVTRLKLADNTQILDNVAFVKIEDYIEVIR